MLKNISRFSVERNSGLFIAISFIAVFSSSIRGAFFPRHGDVGVHRIECQHGPVFSEGLMSEMATASTFFASRRAKSSSMVCICHFLCNFFALSYCRKLSVVKPAGERSDAFPGE